MTLLYVHGPQTVASSRDSHVSMNQQSVQGVLQLMRDSPQLGYMVH